MGDLSPIVIPQSYNYCGIFLTFRCQLKCKYCINAESGKRPVYSEISSKEWIDALNRIETRADLPITLQGGEPTLHPGFYDIVEGIRRDINIDLLTNLQFNIDTFIHRIPPSRLSRNAPYASIRVSFHPSMMNLGDTVDRVKRLQGLGYSIGVWIVDYPGDKFIRLYQQCFKNEGIDCRLKEYLDGKDYGTYKYTELQGKKNMLCKPSELLIAPNGSIHRCHGDLYGNRKAIGNILQYNGPVLSGYAACPKVACNSCDRKVKTDRFQVGGHCAVDIKTP